MYYLYVIITVNKNQDITGQLPAFCRILEAWLLQTWGCPDANSPTVCVFRADSHSRLENFSRAV